MNFGMIENLTSHIFMLVDVFVNFVHNNGKDNLEKFDSKVDEAIFLGYFTTSKAYRVFNKHTLVVQESIHVAFDELVLLFQSILMMTFQQTM